MKKIDLFNLYNRLEDITGFTGRFAYNMIKNKQLMKSEFDALNEVKIQINTILIPYDKERSDVFEKYGVANPNGNGSIILPENTKGMVAIKKIDKKYKDLKDKKIKEIKSFETILEEDIFIDFIKVDFDLLPKDIDGGLMEILITCGVLD